MWIFRPICWVKTCIRSVRYFFNAGLGFIAPISGHDYVQVDDNKPENAEILQCELCGYISN